MLFLENGNSAKLIVMNKKSGQVVKELVLPVGNPKSIHGHFRHARLTDKGTILKEIVWALRAWSEPADMGPSTIIIPLNESRTNENVHFGELK